MSNWSVLLNSISETFGYDQQIKNITEKSSSTAVVEGIDGFVFSRVKEEEVSLSSSITDYPVEDGNVAQNVITLNPERVKLSGVVGEITYGGKGLLMQIADRLAPTLVPIGTLLPSLGDMTQNIYQNLRGVIGELAELESQLDGIVGAAKTAAAALGAVNSDVADEMTLQEKAYVFLEACWKSRRLLTIETPWRYFEDMAIEELRFVQPEISRSYSDIEVTFKRVIAPHTRQTEKVTTRQGRNSIGIIGLIKEAGSAGKTMVQAFGDVSNEIIESVGQSATTINQRINLNLISDIASIRGGLE